MIRFYLSLFIACVGLCAAPIRAIAQLAPRDRADVRPEDGTRSDGGATPFSGAPLSNMVFPRGRLSLEPKIILLEIASTVPQVPDALKLRLPAAGLSVTYGITERVAAFAALYGTRLEQSFETSALDGNLGLGVIVGAAGGAFNVLGAEKGDDFRLTGAIGLLGFRVDGDLSQGRSSGAPILDGSLFRFGALAVFSALQCEWRFSRYLSVVPFATGWRLVNSSLHLGRDRSDSIPLRLWHFSPGLDLWLYVFPESPSHFSLGVLFALTADAPTSTLTLGYTFTFDLAG